MSLNIKKCQIITFTKNRKPLEYAYHIKGVVINRVKVVRDLGVIFDATMSFRPHYDHICGKANRMLSFVLRNSRPFSSIITIYNCLVKSIAEYCSSIWAPIYMTHIDRIEAIQRRFVRALCSKFSLRRKIPDYNNRLRRFK